MFKWHILYSAYRGLNWKKSYSLPKDQIKSIQETKLETEFQII